MKGRRIFISALLIPILFLGAGYGFCPCRFVSTICSEIAPEETVVRSCCHSAATLEQDDAEAKVGQRKTCCCDSKVFLGSGTQAGKVYEGKADSSKAAYAVISSFQTPRMDADSYATAVGPAPPLIPSRPLYLLKSTFLL